MITLLLAGKFLTAIKFGLYRLASWLGIGFFWKKGQHSGQKRFYWLAFCLWAISWAVVIYLSPKIWRAALRWFQ